MLAKHVKEAAIAELGLADKHVTSHVLRHSCAMHTLQATGDVRKVSLSLWLGHASVQSREIYFHADPIEKLEILNSVRMPNLRPGRFRPPNRLLAMLAGNGDGQPSKS